MKDNLEIEEYDLQKIDLYDELMDTFKKCLKSEVQQILSEAREEIFYTQQYIKALNDENERIFNDNCIMAKQLHVCERLQEINSDTVKEKIKSILLSTDEDMIYMDLKQIDNIFEVVLGEKENNG